MNKLNAPVVREITPERLYLRRREFIRDSLLFTFTSTGVGSTLLWLMKGLRAQDHKKRSSRLWSPDPNGPADPSVLTIARRSDYASGEVKTPLESVTTYNNFYEFGTDKSDPAEYAHTLKPRPWTVTIEGEVARPQILEIDQLVKWFSLEERIYRMRCVEA